MYTKKGLARHRSSEPHIRLVFFVAAWREAKPARHAPTRATDTSMSRHNLGGSRGDTDRRRRRLTGNAHKAKQGRTWGLGLVLHSSGPSPVDQPLSQHDRPFCDAGTHTPCPKERDMPSCITLPPRIAGGGAGASFGTGHPALSPFREPPPLFHLPRLRSSNHHSPTHPQPTFATIGKAPLEET